MAQRKKTNPEIEIKLRITDIPELLHKIKKLHVIPQPRLREQNILYDTPQSHLRRRKMLIRLRIETSANPHAPANPAKERVILTSKAPPQPHRNNRPSRYKIRAEREQVASISSRQYAKALTSLGFRPAFRYDKFRTTFRLQDLHLDLDETPAGVYLELEGTPKAIDRAAKALGFAKDQYLRATYWDLYVAACRRRGTKPKNMLFSAK
ncbi:MAG: class IV adenylate cyclase [Candidatus Acidiferrales bacterium]